MQISIIENLLLELKESLVDSCECWWVSKSVKNNKEIAKLIVIFSVTEFQLNILWTFLFILFCNILLILFFWNRYGNTISRHFIKSSTLIEIENLRKSVERLKLPREHTPRI